MIFVVTNTRTLSQNTGSEYITHALEKDGSYIGENQLARHEFNKSQSTVLSN